MQSSCAISTQTISVSDG
uniref:CYP97C4 n=1 Tax=Arundo donax TaxID=35708 RepID=A0A0A9GXX6_ARUDO